MTSNSTPSSYPKINESIFLHKDTDVNYSSEPKVGNNLNAPQLLNGSTVLYIHTVEYYSAIRKWNTDKNYNMNKPQKHYTKWKRSDPKDCTVGCHFYEMSKKGKFTETGAHQWLAGVEAGQSANGHKGFFWGDGNVLKLDHRDSPTAP